jgi:hypothetical protein
MLLLEPTQFLRLVPALALLPLLVQGLELLASVLPL